MTPRNSAPHWSERMPPEDAAALAAYSSREAIVPSAPAPVLMVIDVVESFVGDDVPIAEAQKVSRKACGERAWAAMPGVTGLIDAFRERQLPIVFTRGDVLQSRVGPATRRPDAARDADLSNEIVSEVAPKPEDVIVPKVKASAFFATPLQSFLTKNNHKTIILTGCTTSGCVRATAVDGTSSGFNVLVAEDGVFDRSAISHDVSLIDIDAKYGTVLPYSEIISLLPDRA